MTIEDHIKELDAEIGVEDPAEYLRNLKVIAESSRKFLITEDVNNPEYIVFRGVQIVNTLDSIPNLIV